MIPITFSTLACPHWQIETIIAKATDYDWHPYLDPSEVALPAALRTVQKLFAASQTESA